MSLNIKDAVYGLGVKLGVDMSHAPASNIADMIDYISNGVGAHTGVIAEAVDKMEVGGGTPDYLFVIDPVIITDYPLRSRLDHTWEELHTAYAVESKICIVYYADLGFKELVTNVYVNNSHKYMVETAVGSMTKSYTCDNETDYPVLVRPEDET